MKKSDYMEKLEKKFNLATSLVEDLDVAITELDVEDVDGNLPVETPVPTTEVAVEESIMDMNSLRQDFSLVRSNVLKLVNTGQHILDQASELDISDMKGSQLEALATLQSTIGNNLSLMMDIYKTIASIEKSRYRPPAKQEVVASTVNTGQITNNNIVFSGTSAQLMELIHGEKPTEIVNITP